MPVVAAIPLIAGGIAGAAISSHGASSAANAQVDAANHAADLQHQDAMAALDFQKQQYGTSMGLMRPYYNTGTSALGNLSYLMGLSKSRPSLLTGGYNAAPGTQDPFSAAVNPTDPRLTAQGVGDSSVQALIRRNPAVAAKFGIDPNIFTPLGSGGGPLAAGEPPTGQSMAPDGSITNAMRPQPSGIDVPPGPSGVMNPATGFATNANQPMQGLDESGQPGAPGAVLPGGQAATNSLGGILPNGQGATNSITANGLPGQLSVPADAGGGDQGGGFGSLMTPFSEKFTAPTDVTEQNDPGYQFRLSQGMKALENSAAAKGNLFSGNTGQALSDYAQGSASNEYSNVYSRAMNEFLNRYNMFNQNQTNQYNRMASLAGLGQTSTNELMNAGGNFANNASSILMNSGAQIGQQYNNAAAARASGIVGSSNAWSSSLGNLGMLSLLMKNQGGTPNYPTPDYSTIHF